MKLIARKAFFNSNYEMLHHEQAALLNSLHKHIDTLTEVIHAGLLVHGKLCQAEMRPFHATLQKFFVKNVGL
jgi:dedicator of cytokinesis protein 3